MALGSTDRRFHRQRQLAADHLGVGIGEAEERAGIVGLQVDHVAPLPLRAAAHLRGDGRIAPELAVEREGLVDPVAPGSLDVDAAQRLAVEAGNRAKLQVDVEIEVLGLALGVDSLPVLPEIADLRKPRPSNTSPRIVTFTTPSWPRSAFSVVLSPSDGE